ncbi:DinB family protein [Lewinella sp. LCG006]|uniref:DinB family protein n=1 Tax=Lewinella sp. LCG006 TaxID=3231911 RepID=UPI00346053CD
MKSYRDNGAVGALLDEYELAVQALQKLIATVTNDQLVSIVDPDTDDLDCRSIQTILTHVVRAGYGYAIAIRKYKGEELAYWERKTHSTISAYQQDLERMFAYNEQLFADYPNLQLEEYDPDKKIKVTWGQHYDVEQLMEHAIVHILRHRRQIERFLLRMA